jgi:hypothetical protein
MSWIRKPKKTPQGEVGEHMPEAASPEPGEPAPSSHHEPAVDVHEAPTAEHFVPKRAGDLAPCPCCGTLGTKGSACPVDGNVV